MRSAGVFACHLEPREPSRVPGLDSGEGQQRDRSEGAGGDARLDSAE